MGDTRFLGWVAMTITLGCSSSPQTTDAGTLDGAITNDGGQSTDANIGDERPATCGNDVTDPGEACDGTDVNGFASVDQLVAGYKSGALHCRPDCLGYDVSDGVAGGTVNAASCSASDVASALAAAHHGDTVVVPAGTCTWSTQVALDATSRSIALRGAGATQTIIVVAVATPLSITTTQGFTFAVSGMAFDGHPNYSSVIGINGGAKSWRIHDIRGAAPTSGGLFGPFIATRGSTYGVIDHVTYTGVTQEPFVVVNDVGWASWQQPLSMGTAKAVYVEDDTVDFTGQHDDVCVVGTQNGSRSVLRHSAITNFMIRADGATSASSGALQTEVYDNQFAITDPTHAWAHQDWWEVIQISGGTSVWFDNTLTADSDMEVSTGFALEVARTATGFGSYWGACDGTQRGVCSNVDRTWKTLSGGGAMPCIHDADCGTGQTCKWKLCSVSRMELCAADGDCPTGETCSGSIDGPASSSGYPCFMQPGFATEMQSAPVYIWNNQVTGTSNLKPGLVPITAGSSKQLAVGRDYITSPAPKYVPYVYPHPLVQLGP